MWTRACRSQSTRQAKVKGTPAKWKGRALRTPGGRAGRVATRHGSLSTQVRKTPELLCVWHRAAFLPVSFFSGWSLHHL